MLFVTSWGGEDTEITEWLGGQALVMGHVHASFLLAQRRGALRLCNPGGIRAASAQVNRIFKSTCVSWRISDAGC